MHGFSFSPFPSIHVGANHLASSTGRWLPSALQRIDSGRVLAVSLLSAVVAAVLAAAQQVIEHLSDGHLLLAWMAMWLVAFVIMALLARPARRLAQQIQHLNARWSTARAKAAADRQLWDAILCDHRLLSELQAAMSRDAG